MIDEIIDGVTDYGWDEPESFVMTDAELVQIYGSELSIDDLLSVTESEGGEL